MSETIDRAKARFGLDDKVSEIHHRLGICVARVEVREVRP